MSLCPIPAITSSRLLQASRFRVALLTGGRVKIGYQAAIKEDKQYNAYSTGVGPGWGYGPGWGRGYGYGGPTNTTVQTTTIHIGELALDMYDAAEKKLVWRGEASKTLDEKAKPEKRQKNLQKAVAKLLKDYPPPVKK